jgi:hypothetical protein
MTPSASLTETLPILDVDDPITRADDVATPLRVVKVYNCSRLGRTANPPSRFSDWFRFGRRR